MLKLSTFFAAFLFYFATCQASYSIQKMNLEEKIGQLLMVHFNGETANEDAKTLIQKTYVGGFIYYNWSNGLHSPQQVRDLSHGLQKLADANRLSIPLLIAADQEGGLVSRLTQGFTVFPGNKALGLTQNPQLAELSAQVIGKELRAVGINMNLAPVADINSNPKNPVIGIRAFGDSAETVIPYARKALEGYHKAGIITSLKHFPGHGDVEVDSHEDLPVVKKNLDELEKLELLPFATLAVETDTIMTAHIIVKGLDPDNCATLSKPSLDYLRKTIGFTGIILSDSLVMEGVLKKCESVEDAAVRALDAGCDILILGGKQLIGSHNNLELTVQDVQRIHKYLVEAVQNGRLSSAKIDQSVQRILNLKDRYALAESFKKNSPLDVNVASKDNQSLAYKIASLAIRITKNRPLQLPGWKQLHIAICAPELVKLNLESSSFLTLGKEIHPVYYSGLNPSQNEMTVALEIAEKADLLICFSYNSWKNSGQSTLINAMLTTGKPTVLITLRDALDAVLYPQANLILNLSSPTAPSMQAACDILKGELYD